jgi:hypothetical protein
MAGVRGVVAGGALAVAALALAGCGGTAGRLGPAASVAAQAPDRATSRGDPYAEALLAAGGAASLGLIGLSGDEARRLLGPPGVLRREQLAEFWRYRLEPCVLDLYLYQERAADPQRVRYAELRRDRLPARPADCRGPVLEISARGA